VAHNRRPQKILAWRPVILLGGGLGLVVFEAAQPMFGRPVEWAIVSVAATMMGLELFSRSSEPDDSDPPPPGGSPAQADGPASPGNQGRPGSPGAQAASVAPAVKVSRKAPVVVAAAVA